MAASPGGRAAKVTPRQLEILRDLWLSGHQCDLIAERLGIGESRVSKLAREAGLPPRHRRGPRD